MLTYCPEIVVIAGAIVFENIKTNAQERAAAVATAAQDKIEDLIQDFNKMLPFVEELGLSVASFDIEAGLLPKIKTSLIGSIDNIDNETVERLIAEHDDNKLLIAILKAVLMAKGIHEKLEGAYISILKDIVIDVQLGIPPSISCSFK
ncbi:MAG: hypothetical protein WBB29_00650 [Geitlerinemataceae cyanobacterium]